MEEKIKELEDKNKELQEVIKESDKEISRLKAENESISETLYETKLHLKKYTSPENNKNYYDKNKEKCLRRVKEYQERTNYKPSKEKTKEYNRNAYLLRKVLEHALNEEEQEG
jgi:hypothetical protein